MNNQRCGFYHPSMTEFGFLSVIIGGQGRFRRSSFLSWLAVSKLTSGNFNQDLDLFSYPLSSILKGSFVDKKASPETGVNKFTLCLGIF